jgi:hypothetical protein
MKVGDKSAPSDEALRNKLIDTIWIKRDINNNNAKNNPKSYAYKLADDVLQLAIAYASERERAAAQQELISLDEILDVKSIVDIRLYIDERMVKLAELQANEGEAKPPAQG